MGDRYLGNINHYQIKGCRCLGGLVPSLSDVEEVWIIYFYFSTYVKPADVCVYSCRDVGYM